MNEQLIWTIFPIILFFGIFGATWISLFIWHSTAELRYNFKRNYVKKYKPKCKVNDIVYVEVGDDKDKILCRVESVFVEKAKKKIEKSYFLIPLQFGFNLEIPFEEYVYSYDYFDRLSFDESYLKHVF